MKKWIIFSLLSVIWGSSFILIKKGVVAFAPEQVAALRLFATFICFLPFVIKLFSQQERKHLKILILAALFGNGIPAFLFAFAQTRIDSSLSGALNSLTPVFTLIFGMILFKLKVSVSSIIGILLGLAGAISLIVVTADGLSFEPFGILVVIATMCYATSVNIVKSKLSEVRPIMITGVGMLFIGPPCGIYLFSTDFIDIIDSHPYGTSSLLAILLLAVFGTALALVMFNHMIKESSAIFASSVAYAIPVVAVLIGFIDGETISFSHIIGILVILIGIYLINRKK